VKPAENSRTLEFLAQKGKFVPSAGQGRRPSSAQRNISRRGRNEEREIFPDWKPKVFDGFPLCWVDPREDTVKNAGM